MRRHSYFKSATSSVTHVVHPPSESSSDFVMLQPKTGANGNLSLSVTLAMVLIYRRQEAPFSPEEKGWPVCSHQHKTFPQNEIGQQDNIVVRVESGELSQNAENECFSRLDSNRLVWNRPVVTKTWHLVEGRSVTWHEKQDMSLRRNA